MEMNRKLNTTEFLNEVCVSPVRLISTKNLSKQYHKTIYTCVHLLLKWPNHFFPTISDVMKQSDSK